MRLSSSHDNSITFHFRKRKEKIDTACNFMEDVLRLMLIDPNKIKRRSIQLLNKYIPMLQNI